MESIQRNCCSFIFTSAPESSADAFKEIEDLLRSNSSGDGKAPGLSARWLIDGTGLITAEMSWLSIVDAFRLSPPIFVRHICPVFWEEKLDDPSDGLDWLAGYAPLISEFLDIDKTFSVQTRILDDNDERGFSRFALNTKLADILTARGYQLDVKLPQLVVSVVISADTAYIGVSAAKDNLSDWAGGERRLARSENRISRAEFKLEEAFEVFDISLPHNGIALDLGAAPGGWTRVLRQHDLRVIAVDPAKLDPRLDADPLVEHRRETTQTFLPTDVKFDIIVNDMRMDARDSSKLMCATADNLSKMGFGIITLKLPEHGQMAIIRKASEILRNSFMIAGIKQLFHNRSEVTVYLRSKE